MNWNDLAQFAPQLWVAWLTLVFLGIAFYAFRPKNREYFKHCAEIPFGDDEPTLQKAAQNATAQRGARKK